MTEAVSAFRRSANEAGGSHLTREARMQTGERFARAMHERGFQVRDAESVKLKHLQAYVDARRAEGVSGRTLQNEAAHLRGILRAEGREVGRAEWSNRGLKIDGCSRDGTNRAATREEIERVAAKVGERDAGLRAMVHLSRELGLRAQEAIRSGESLARWERQLERGERVSVVYGTKGGRPREAAPADRQRALAAVREARSVAESRGGRLLPGDLKQAGTLARNAMSRAGEGVSWHSMRYAYAQDRVQSYRDAGFSEREARAATSCDLGHGDRRGAYVAQVYAQG